jgi:uncharacterized protein (UPF0210 family)
MSRQPTPNDISALIDRQRAAGASLALRSLAVMIGVVEAGLDAVRVPDQAELHDIRRRLGSIVVDLEATARRIEEGGR